MADEVKRQITQETIDRYGRINGDNDIIHYDEAYAHARGFRGTLAHGLMVMAYAAEIGARRHGADWHRRGTLSVTWTAPVCPGDEVVIAADGERIEGTVQAEPVLVGTAALRPDRG
ncbi:MaoC family dehydratase [Actinomadura sp. 1N219]|uniref:MaoC family dehydratase n=1 Tax=Actinomadura sp. 1N219 TaxID=3375152 RepID=UPI0037B9E2B4